jgi:hypothetical protein
MPDNAQHPCHLYVNVKGPEIYQIIEWFRGDLSGALVSYEGHTVSASTYADQLSSFVHSRPPGSTNAIIINPVFDNLVDATMFKLKWL